MVKALFRCACGAEVNTLSDAVRCNICTKMYHLSCPLNKGYISQSLRRPHIRILTCKECCSTTHIDEPIQSGDQDTSNSSCTNSTSYLNDLESSSRSNDPNFSSNLAGTNYERASSIPDELEACANLCKPSTAEGSKKNCGLCGNPVSRESKVLECIGCEKMYHYECAAYSPGQLQELFEKNGWTCVNCFVCEDDLKKVENCRKCKKPVLEKSKKLQCHRCNSVFHQECEAHATAQVKGLPQKDRWFCGKCQTCDKKEQMCSKCKKPVKKESKVLECNKCGKSFHRECGVHAPKKLQEWFEKKGWICGDCLVKVDDSKQQEHMCSKCKKPAKKGSKMLECNKCGKLFHHECAVLAPKELQERFEKKGWICGNCLAGVDVSKEQEDESKWKSLGKKAAIGVGLTAACLGGIPLAVGALGFGAAGVTAGSLAAAYQSAFLGGTIVSGSAFAVLQSIGAAGLAVSTQAGIAAVCTALPFLSELQKQK